MLGGRTSASLLVRLFDGTVGQKFRSHVMVERRDSDAKHMWHI